MKNEIDQEAPASQKRRLDIIKRYKYFKNRCLEYIRVSGEMIVQMKKNFDE